VYKRNDVLFIFNNMKIVHSYDSLLRYAGTGLYTRGCGIGLIAGFSMEPGHAHIRAPARVRCGIRARAGVPDVLRVIGNPQYDGPVALRLTMENPATHLSDSEIRNDIEHNGRWCRV
jgi:hypothetical protein